MRHFFFPYANRGASLVHAHVRRKGEKITGLGVEHDGVLNKIPHLITTLSTYQC